MSAVYQVQVFQFAGDFSYGTQIAEIDRAKFIGWSDYVNDVPEAFFTLLQTDPAAYTLSQYLGKAHVRVLRDGAVVWNGLLGLEMDATDEDAIFYCHGYLAALTWLLSDWNQVFTNQQVDSIVSTLWTRAKTTLTQSNLGFVTTGTIQAPVTTSGGATPIVIPNYTLFNKPILHAFQELAAISMSDTTNAVIFEITHSLTPTFNLWNNKGVDRPNIVLEWGGKHIHSFKHYRAPVWHRNDQYAVGASANNVLFRRNDSNAGDINAIGRRQKPLFLSWVRDETELERVAKLRLARSIRDDIDISVRLFMDKLLPPGVSGAGYNLGDRILVKINHGATQFNSYQAVYGFQCVVLMGGNEYLRLMLAQRSGT